MNTRTGFARRLAQALAADDRLEGEVAREAGVVPSQLSSWKKGASPNTDNIEALVRALGINGHWLLTGEGPMHLSSPMDVTRLLVIGKIAKYEADDATVQWVADRLAEETIGG